MTATQVPALVPPLPGPDAPVIPARRIVGGYTGPIARYAAPAWPLGTGAPFNEANMSKAYGGEAAGYTDYPVLQND